MSVRYLERFKLGLSYLGALHTCEREVIGEKNNSSLSQVFPESNSTNWDHFTRLVASWC